MNAAYSARNTSGAYPPAAVFSRRAARARIFPQARRRRDLSLFRPLRAPAKGARPARSPPPQKSMASMAAEISINSLNYLFDYLVHVAAREAQGVALVRAVNVDAAHAAKLQHGDESRNDLAAAAAGGIQLRQIHAALRKADRLSGGSCRARCKLYASAPPASALRFRHAAAGEYMFESAFSRSTGSCRYSYSLGLRGGSGDLEKYSRPSSDASLIAGSPALRRSECPCSWCSSEAMRTSSSDTSSSCVSRRFRLDIQRCDAICTNSLAISRSSFCIWSRYSRYWSSISEILMSRISILFLTAALG